MPAELREQRRELLRRMCHGDTPGVLWLLDAGVDPWVRDGLGRTLLHMLHLVDHEALLPRLLAAGLDLEAQDRFACTPLCVAVFEQGTPELVHALVDTGARPDAIWHERHGREHWLRRDDLERFPDCF